MNRIEIENDHWVERYLAGRLSESEARRFEAYWIENPDLIRDLERGAQLKSGLAALSERRQLDALVRSSWWPGGLRLLVLAASVAFVAIGTVLWNGAREGAGTLLAAAPSALPDLAGAALPRGAVLSIMRLRSSASVDAVVTLPDSPRALELRILPELAPDAPLPAPGGSPLYSLSLTQEDPQGEPTSTSRIEGLVAARDGFVTVFVDSRTLRPARYRLRLESAGVQSAVAGSGFVLDVRSGNPTP